MALSYKRIPEFRSWSACENRDGGSDDVVYHNGSNDSMSTTR